MDEKENELVVENITVEHIIITCSKDISINEINLLKEYGKVIIFDSKVFQNVPINTLEYDYFILELLCFYTI